MVLHFIWIQLEFSLRRFWRRFFLLIENFWFFYVAEKDEFLGELWGENNSKKNSKKNLQWFYILSKCRWIFSNFYLGPFSTEIFFSNFEFLVFLRRWKKMNFWAKFGGKMAVRKVLWKIYDSPTSNLNAPEFFQIFIWSCFRLRFCFKFRIFFSYR